MNNKRQKNRKFFSDNFFPKNNRGWIRIVEALTAILLIAVVVLIVINQNQRGDEGLSIRIQNSERAVLREIQLNSTLREDIVATSGTVEWDSFPIDVKNKIEAKSPSWLNCTAKICNQEDLCSLSESNEENVYAESVIISATIDTYEPRQLKMFCWQK